MSWLVFLPYPSYLGHRLPPCVCIYNFQSTYGNQCSGWNDDRKFCIDELESYDPLDTDALCGICGVDTLNGGPKICRTCSYAPVCSTFHPYSINTLSLTRVAIVRRSLAYELLPPPFSGSGRSGRRGEASCMTKVPQRIYRTFQRSLPP